MVLPKGKKNVQKAREMQGRPARESMRRGVSRPRAARNEERSRSAPRRRVSRAPHSRAPKANPNVQLITQAIRDLNKSATLEEIVAQLVLRLGRNTCGAEIYETTAHTLKKGVKYGFIQMDNGGYCLPPAPITEAEKEVDLQTASLTETVEKSVPQAFNPSAMSVLSVDAPPPAPITEAEKEVDLQTASLTETVEKSVPVTFNPSAISVVSVDAPQTTPRTPSTSENCILSD